MKAKKISDLILMSDVDGTLVRKSGEIPPRNLAALERFTQGGGRFALSTGRSILYSKDLAAQLPINFPCVLFNGGMIYDYMNHHVKHQVFLPKQCRDYFVEIAENFSDAEVLVVDAEHYNEISPAQNVQPHHSKHRTRFSSIDEIQSKDWYKGLIVVGDEERMTELMAFVTDKSYPHVRFVNTLGTMMEMLPLDCSKGNALKHLMQQENFNKENLVAIGDYYNDLEMLSLAGLGATLETSPDEIKRSADLVVGSCHDGAVADLIEYLENTYGY